MRQHHRQVAVVSSVAGFAAALFMLPPVSFAVSASSQPTIATDAPVVDAAEAEQRGFNALTANRAQAILWFEQAARGGRPAAQWMLGRHYFDAKGDARNLPRTVELMRAAAVQGFAPAQSFLGYLYLEGLGTERNEEQAFAWFKAAARQEDAYALGMLAEFYGRGMATQQDFAMTARVLRRAAELGNVDAARSAYGLMLYGPKEQRDPRAAIHFLTKAAKSNDADAAYMLGREHLHGRNVQDDPAIAAQWLRRSADGGNVLASLWLSELHFKGLGVTRDPTRAEELLDDALARASIYEKNAFAWELSVGMDERLRDGTLAVRVLEPAMAAVSDKFAAHVDTLAAAYAEVRQFDRAVETQLSAIDRARSERRPQTMIAGMASRLDLYKRGEPYREVAK